MTIVYRDGIGLATAAEAIKEARLAAGAMAAEVAPGDDLLGTRLSRCLMKRGGLWILWNWGHFKAAVCWQKKS